MSPSPHVRPTGFPSLDAPQGGRYEVQFVPTSGHTLASPLVVGPSSIVSGQNVWSENGELVSRWKLSRESIINPVVTNAGLDSGTSSIVGGMVYTGVGSPALRGPYYVLGAVSGTLWLGNRENATGNSLLSFSQLSYTSSTGTSRPLVGIPQTNNVYGATVYSAATDQNILIISAGTTLNYCYAGNGATPPVYSHVTGGPGSVDVVTLANRAVAWGCATIAAPNHIQQRVQWSVAGDPFDWTGIGSGFEDLVDMQGAATRVFVRENELILATDREIWRGRYVGLPYVFQFSPIETRVGIPYGKAAIQTPEGIFWLGADFMVYVLAGDQPTPIGAAFQTLLQQDIRSATGGNIFGPFFTYNERLRHLRLWYTLGGVPNFPNRSLTLDLGQRTWWRERYDHKFSYGVSTPVDQIRGYGDATSNTNWNQSEVLFTSSVTACYFAESATSDLGSVVTQVADLGAMFTDDPRYLKTLKEVRLEFAGGVSAVTVSVSPTLGSGYSEIKTSIVSRMLAGVGSATSVPVQSVLTFDTEARYPTLRLTSESTNRWRLASVYAMAERQGR